MKSTFRILFYAKWEASDEAKMLPIYVRITINGTKARFSLKIRVSEKIWDAADLAAEIYFTPFDNTSSLSTLHFTLDRYSDKAVYVLK